MSVGVVWIQLDRAFEILFRRGPVPVEQFHVTERAVRFGGRGIEFDRFCRRLLRGRGTFRKRLQAKHAEPVVVIGDTGVGEGIVGIEIDRFLVTLERLREADFGELKQIVDRPNPFVLR